MEFQSDFERMYREEFIKMINTGYFPVEATTRHDGKERYKWDGGRLYQDGIPIQRWQLDQQMHQIRQHRREECFTHCMQCARAQRNQVTEGANEIRFGKPMEGERKGQFPCDDQRCSFIFDYLSQLMRHQEIAHQIQHDWDEYKRRLNVANARASGKCKASLRFGHPCKEPAVSGRSYCSNDAHKRQVLAKIKKGELTA